MYLGIFSRLICNESSSSLGTFSSPGIAVVNEIIHSKRYCSHTGGSCKARWLIAVCKAEINTLLFFSCQWASYHELLLFV